MTAQTLIPRWARVPNYVQAKDVEATNRGWQMKNTGELIVSFKGLADKIEQLNREIEFSMKSINKKADTKQSKQVPQPSKTVETTESGDEEDKSSTVTENSTKPETIDDGIGGNEPSVSLEDLAEENDTLGDEEDTVVTSPAPLSAESIGEEIKDAVKEAETAKPKTTAKKTRKPRTKKKK